MCVTAQTAYKRWIKCKLGVFASNAGENAMASSTSCSRDDQWVGTLNRRPALRPPSKRDAVLLGTTSFQGDGVYDVAGKFLGEIEELILDIHSGRIAYALMAVGGFLAMGRKLLALPWGTVTVDRVYQRCVINVELERLIEAPALDGDLLPRMADPSWATEIHNYFGCKPYWE
jgi:sporulation protein YlmC with PRC-barrel domain